MNPSITRVLTYGMEQTHVLPQSAYKTCATNWYPQTYFNHCVTVCLLLRRLCGRIARMQSPLHAPVVVDVQLTTRLRVRIIPCSRGSTCRQRVFRNGRRHRVSQYIRFAENPLYRNDIIYFRRIQLDIARSHHTVSVVSLVLPVLFNISQLHLLRLVMREIRCLLETKGSSCKKSRPKYHPATSTRCCSGAMPCGGL